MCVEGGGLGDEEEYYVKMFLVIEMFLGEVGIIEFIYLLVFIKVYT